MNIIKYLGNLGYGTRREVTATVGSRRVTRRDGTAVRDGDVFSHDDLLIDGEPLDPPPGSVIMLHKPMGFICSTKERGPIIHELLSPRFPHRSPPMVSVGRLDVDTSGLLLLTDDGQLNHRLTSPKSQLPKCYDAELASDLRGDEGVLFAAGTLLLNGEAEPLKPATLEQTGPRAARVRITEGRYHQIRRMFAAVGNHVVALHRVSIGRLTLGDLPAGESRVLSGDDLRLVFEGESPQDP